MQWLGNIFEVGSLGHDKFFLNGQGKHQTPGGGLRRPGRGLILKTPKPETTVPVGFTAWGNYRKNVALTKFQVADAELLPFADNSFDTALSTFGVMFTPDHAKAASELTRVCRPGGCIGLANWTPSSFIGQVFKTLGRFIAPPAGVQSPALWGTEEHLRYLFGEEVASITTTSRTFNFRYRSAAHFIDVFRSWYGPVHKAFAALPTEQALALETELTTLLNKLNRAEQDSLIVPSEYLEVVITLS